MLMLSPFCHVSPGNTEQWPDIARLIIPAGHAQGQDVSSKSHSIPDVQVIICLDDVYRIVVTLHILQEGICLHRKTNKV